MASPSPTPSGRRGASARSTKSAGEKLRPNPNSAAVWQYTGFDANGDGKLDFEETMHRSISMAVIKDGLLVLPIFPDWSTVWTRRPARSIGRTT